MMCNWHCARPTTVKQLWVRALWATQHTQNPLSLKRQQLMHSYVQCGTASNTTHHNRSARLEVNVPFQDGIMAAACLGATSSYQARHGVGHWSGTVLRQQQPLARSMLASIAGWLLGVCHHGADGDLSDLLGNSVSR